MMICWQIFGFLSALFAVFFISVSDFMYQIIGEPGIVSYISLPIAASIIGLLTFHAHHWAKIFKNLRRVDYGWFLKAVFTFLILVLVTFLVLKLEQRECSQFKREFGLYLFGFHVTETTLKLMNIFGSGAFAIQTLCLSRLIRPGYEFGLMCTFLELTMHSAIKLGFEAVAGALIFSFLLIFIRCMLEHYEEGGPSGDIEGHVCLTCRIFGFLSSVTGVVCISISEFLFKIVGEPKILTHLVIFLAASFFGLLTFEAHRLRKKVQNFHTSDYGWILKAVFTFMIILGITLLTVKLEERECDQLRREKGQLQLFGVLVTEAMLKQMNAFGSGAFALQALCLSRQINPGYEFGFTNMFIELTLYSATKIHYGAMVIAALCSFGVIFFRCALEHYIKEDGDGGEVDGGSGVRLWLSSWTR